MYWRVERNLHRSLDLINMISPENRFLTWWSISDKIPSLTAMCETLSKLVCHASLLKVDDVWLKGSTLATRFCTLCDMGQEEDVRHLVLQCSVFEYERSEMFEEIRQLPNNVDTNILDNELDILGILLGKSVDGYLID